MARIIVGTSALDGADPERMRGAGIEWVRQGFPLPFEDRLGGETTEAYEQAKARTRDWARKGFGVMGVTPLPGICRMEPDDRGKLEIVWHSRMPDWMGPAGSEQYVANYRAVCHWLGEDLAELVSLWQIANELDIVEFAGPLNPRQACELVAAAARGLKDGNPSAPVGTNSASSDKAYYLYGRLFAQPDCPLDYCGVDAYYGTWLPGGPDDWGNRIEELHALTGVPVLINEWGFSSAGEAMSLEERTSGVYCCQIRKWRYTWGAGHSPEGQADYVRTAFEAFSRHRDILLGAFFYRWEDQQQCWQCGSPDCPVETAWGLLDREGRPKPSFHAFQEGVAALAG